MKKLIHYIDFVEISAISIQVESCPTGIYASWDLLVNHNCQLKFIGQSG